MQLELFPLHIDPTLTCSFGSVWMLECSPTQSPGPCAKCAAYEGEDK